MAIGRPLRISSAALSRIYLFGKASSASAEKRFQFSKGTLRRYRFHVNLHFVSEVDLDAYFVVAEGESAEIHVFLFNDLQEHVNVAGVVGYVENGRRIFPWEGRDVERFQAAEGHFVSPLFTATPEFVASAPMAKLKRRN